eukprot:9481837-Pyramimonas_sp.AAC.1
MRSHLRISMSSDPGGARARIARRRTAPRNRTACQCQAQPGIRGQRSGANFRCFAAWLAGAWRASCGFLAAPGSRAPRARREVALHDIGES